MAKIRIFNEEGISEFEKQLEQFKLEEIKNLSEGFLFSPKFSSEIKPSTNIEKRHFNSKKEFVEYLMPKIKPFGVDIFFLEGMWTWLAAFYFENLVPKNKNSSIGATSKYVLRNSRDYTRYYKHYLATPCRLAFITNYNEIFLAGKLGAPGEIYEQLASRQKVIANIPFIESVEELYWDKKNSSFKRGYTNRNKGGNLRRLAKEVYDQFEVTYDFASMRKNEILKLLPSDFEKFLPNKANLGSLNQAGLK